MGRSRLHCWPWSFSLLMLCGVGCGRHSSDAPTNESPSVSVSEPLQREVTDHADFTGRLAAPDTVQVRARVSGYITKIDFTEGAEVGTDAVLFEIDPRPFETALSQVRAQIKLQQAQLKYNEALYQRNLRLVNNGQAVSVEETQQSLAQRDTAEANLEAARAAAEQAEINLNWTKVRAPVRGRVGRSIVTRGNLVVADQTVLTSVVSLDPLYAYFDVDERTVLRIQQLIREGKVESARAGAVIPVNLGLATETGFPHEGTINFVNNQVDATTGTLLVRGVFPNPKPSIGDRVLTPGLFVRVRVAVGVPYRALLISQRAFSTDQDVTYVFVLDENNAVARRDVQLGTQQDGGLQVVTAGIRADDRVVVTGLQRLRPGVVVTPKVVPMPTGTTTAQPTGEVAKAKPTPARP